MQGGKWLHTCLRKSTESLLGMSKRGVVGLIRVFSILTGVRLGPLQGRYALCAVCVKSALSTPLVTMNALESGEG